jgi:hypothetical protein
MISTAQTSPSARGGGWALWGETVAYQLQEGWKNKNMPVVMHWTAGSAVPLQS